MRRYIFILYHEAIVFRCRYALLTLSYWSFLAIFAGLGSAVALDWESFLARAEHLGL